MNSKPASSIVLACVMSIALSLSGCDDSNTANTEKEKATAQTEKMRIALVMKTLTNPFFVSMEEGAREAEKEFGIELLVKTAAEETSIHQQIDIVDQLVRSKQVHAIVIAPGDSVELIPSLKAAQDQGIKVVNIDNRLDPAFSKKFGLSDVPFISVDNEAAAYLSAKYISDKISTPTKVAVLEGIQTAGNAQDRKNGALRAFSENSNISIAASRTANWKIDEAYEVIKNIFTEIPDIGAIFCANDMMALGVLKYLEETGRDQIPVAAFDAIVDAKAAIQAGTLSVSIDQLPEKQGFMGVQTAVDLLNGKTPSMEILIDVLVVDKAALK